MFHSLRLQSTDIGLWSLEERQTRSNLIEVYKMINKLLNVNFDNFFDFDTTRSTRVGVVTETEEK